MKKDREEERQKILAWIIYIVVMFSTGFVSMYTPYKLNDLGVYNDLPVPVSFLSTFFMLFLLIRYIFVPNFDSPTPKRPKEALFLFFKPIIPTIIKDLLFIRWLLTGKDYK